MIFETHAHYDDEQYNEDRENLLREIFSAGIDKIINVASTMESSRECIKLAEQYENIYAAVGVHPSEIDCIKGDTYEELRSMAAHRKVVAIGEIGLDYYWDKEKEVQERQKVEFIKQLDLARELDLPVIIHSRDAAADTMEILKNQPKRENPGIIHCYSYSVEMAREFIKMGWHIGVGGVVTFKNAKVLKEVVKEIPLERIVLETDCPYMAPEPHRGKRNSSIYIPHIVDKIAELKNVSGQEVEEVTYNNALRVYQMK
ncbi:MAG: TatD family hydrolase [Lachnospiraceae bacterium]|nr:TatD family hydrolase [Lachnospiraceae bacterium]